MGNSQGWAAVGEVEVDVQEDAANSGEDDPQQHQAELAKLQDNVPPVPSERILAILATEFGQPVAVRFAAFDPRPLAAASRFNGTLLPR